ncbi:MAG: DUF5996 family protein [Pseudomonadota bacterium]
MTAHDDTWPSLPLQDWAEACATLHLWLQIVGKIRLMQSPWVNHSWHVTLYLTAQGLTTSPIPHGSRLFQIDFDFIRHQLTITTSDWGVGGFALEPMPVARFYTRLMGEMNRLRLPVSIRTMPSELDSPIPFEQDDVHQTYAREDVHRYWRILAQTHRVMHEFRARFIGKCSPVQLFWGAMDLAVTRFSGQRAPEHPGGIPHLPDWVVREAYSHEVSSCGFWPGSGPIPYPAFYAYAYPEPPGFAKAPIQPAAAFYSPELREFILPYEAVRQSGNPEETLLEFFQASYEVAADLGRWDRASVEPEQACFQGTRDDK